MKLLITGGAGFVGTNLVAHLRQTSDDEITVFDNESLGRREHVAPFGVRFIRGDILDREALSKASKGQDVVIHLAADTRVMDSIADPTHNFRTNAIGTFNVLTVARDCGISRVLGASTGGAILGEAKPPVNEEMVARPLSPYGASKLSGEGYMNAFAASYGMHNASLRFSNIYGPRSYHKGSVVAHFFRSILARKPLIVYGDGTQIRDYLFVADLAEGIRQALAATVQGIFQLGSNRPTSLNELIEMIRRVTGQQIEIQHDNFRSGEIHTTWCDVTKSKAAFGFAPNTSLEAGLRATWQWFCEREARG